MSLLLLRRSFDTPDGVLNPYRQEYVVPPADPNISDEATGGFDPWPNYWLAYRAALPHNSDGGIRGAATGAPQHGWSHNTGGSGHTDVSIVTSDGRWLFAGGVRDNLFCAYVIDNPIANGADDSGSSVEGYRLHIGSPDGLHQWYVSEEFDPREKLEYQTDSDVGIYLWTISDYRPSNTREVWLYYAGPAGDGVPGWVQVTEDNGLRISEVLADHTGDLNVEIRIRVNTPGFEPVDITQDLLVLPLAPAPATIPAAGPDLDGTTVSTNPWNGRAETGRTNLFAVLHTAENGGEGVDGNAANVVRYLKSLQGRYAGYHYVVDQANTIMMLDPTTHRAYGSLGGNDGIQIGMALSASDWANMSSSEISAITDRVKAILVAAGIPRQKLTADLWPESTSVAGVSYKTPPDSLDTLAEGGFLFHSDIQGDRSDPGDDFPTGNLFD